MRAVYRGGRGRAQISVRAGPLGAWHSEGGVMGRHETCACVSCGVVV